MLKGNQNIISILENGQEEAFQIELDEILKDYSSENHTKKLRIYIISRVIIAYSIIALGIQHA